MSEPFVITKAWLEAHASGKNGHGWTHHQLQTLGVPVKCARGWKNRLHGTVCTEAQRLAFEGPPVYAKKTLRLRKARETVTYMEHKADQLDNGVW